MIREAIFKLVDKQDLTRDEAYSVIMEVMQGQTTPVQTAAFLSALSTKSTKSETIDEITGCAQAMRQLATRVSYDKPTLEIVGTGGDKAKTFNISTTAAFVIASGGVKVAKHGNRAASSKSGTADVQEALGVNIHQDPDKARQMLDEVGMTFFFAQDYHSAMKYVGPIRSELGIRTVFNILGPITNPINPEYIVMGVYDGSLVEPLARVLASLGVKRGMVVFGKDVLDEISTACDTNVCEINNGEFESYNLSPEDFNMKRCTKRDLEGGSPDDNAATIRGILDNSITDCRLDTVLLNAGAGLYVAGKASSMADGVKQARSLIEDGLALKTMQAYIDASNKQ